MNTEIGRIRQIIEMYVKSPNKSPCDYQELLAKYSRLDELDIRLNELESQGLPEDPEEAALQKNEISEIASEVRKLTSGS